MEISSNGWKKKLQIFFLSLSFSWCNFALILAFDCEAIHFHNLWDDHQRKK